MFCFENSKVQLTVNLIELRNAKWIQRKMKGCIMVNPKQISAARDATVRLISPIRLFVLLLFVLFFAETLIMFILPVLFSIPESPLVNFADSLMLIMLSAPVIWILIVQPLRHAVKTEAAWAAALLEHVIDGVIVFDVHGKITSFNPAAERIFGYLAWEVVGQNLSGLLTEHGDEGEKIFPFSGRHNSACEETSIHHDVLGRRIDGTAFPMDFSVSRVHLAGKTAFIGIFRDATERKQNEKAMIDKQIQLEELNLSLEERVQATVSEIRERDRILIQQNRLAAMGEMINNIAHQWRQPLNVLGLLNQQLRLKFDSNAFSKEYLDTNVDKSMKIINHMSQTIDDFRNFFKPDKEKVEFTIYEVVARTISLVEDGFKNLQIGIDFRVYADPVITGFPNEFSQVLLNILMNARDAFLEKPTHDAKITISLRTEEERAVVTIADNAGGMAEDIIGKIFDPYFTTKGPDRGEGLGLFMSKNIIEKSMGGMLTARNTNQGAEFKIKIPI